MRDYVRWTRRHEHAESLRPTSMRSGRMSLRNTANLSHYGVPVFAECSRGPPRDDRGYPWMSL